MLKQELLQSEQKNKLNKNTQKRQAFGSVVFFLILLIDVLLRNIKKNIYKILKKGNNSWFRDFI